MTSAAIRILIVGHGVAGVTAAQAARAQDGAAQIAIAGEEPHGAYYRVRLSHDLATGIDPGRIRLRSPAWYESARIDVIRGARVTAIDPSRRTATLAGGRELDYDTSVLATGSSSFLPPFKGNNRPGVRTLRSAAEASAIRELALAADRAAVAGGGLLGLEAAYALSRLGKPVVVLERGPWLLRKQLDREGGEVLAAVLGRAGIAVLTGAEVAAAYGRAGGATAPLAGVTLKDGRRLDCGLLVVAAGVRPNSVLAREAGIETVREGIKVDDRLETSSPGVYACGDAAAHTGGNYSIWPQAMAQGKVAGTNAAGGAETYTPIVPQNLLNVAGTTVLAVGEVGEPPEEPSSAAGPGQPGLRAAVSRMDPGSGKYARFVFRGVTLAGAMLIGEPGLAKLATAAVERALEYRGLWELPDERRFDAVARGLAG